VRVERFVTNAPPFITAQPQSLLVTRGGSAAFDVTAGGTGPLAYQWRHNGTNLAGATGSSFSRTNVQAADAGHYSVFITNVAGNVTSADAVLTVMPATSPKFDAITLLSAPQSGLRLVLSGDAGFNYAILTSSNLTDWVVWTNVFNAVGTVEITDVPGAEAVPRFYRAAFVP
jgi:hypothetical protein